MDRVSRVNGGHMKTNKSIHIARLRSRGWQYALWTVAAIWVLAGMRGMERPSPWALAQESDKPPVTTTAKELKTASTEPPAKAESSVADKSTADTSAGEKFLPETSPAEKTPAEKLSTEKSATDKSGTAEKSPPSPATKNSLGKK